MEFLGIRGFCNVHSMVSENILLLFELLLVLIYFHRKSFVNACMDILHLPAARCYVFNSFNALILTGDSFYFFLRCLSMGFLLPLLNLSVLSRTLC